MTPFGLLARALAPQGLLALSEQLVVYQCHHHALFLDRTVSDALGGEGFAVRRKAAFEAAHGLVSAFCADLAAASGAERLEIGSALFTAAGHGRISLEVTAEGGSARGRGLFFGESFAEKYAGIIKNRRPIDTFAAGYIAAAASLAFPSDWSTFEADETSCVAEMPVRGPECAFMLGRRAESPRFGAAVTRPLVELLPVTVGPQAAPSPTATRAAEELGRLLQALSAGEEGAIRAFGVRLALCPVGYTGQITFDTVHLVEKRAPELFPIVATLFCEAAQLGAFHLLGGVLGSSAWRASYGAPPSEPEERLEVLLGMARALGWGAFHAAEFSPGKRLVLCAPITHESAYYTIRHGPTVRSRLFGQQGLALALMQLLHRVDFTAENPVGPGTYDALFRSGTRFHAEETRSTLRGDGHCEVVVEAMAER